MNGPNIAGFKGDSSPMIKLNGNPVSSASVRRAGGFSVFLALTIGTPAVAQEACVVCAGPDAVYRCTVEKSDKLARFGSAGDKALQHVCAKEMARQGSHERCSVRRDTVGATCDGVPRVLTLASIIEAVTAPPPTVVSPAPPGGPVAPPPVAPIAAKPADANPPPPRTVQELAERTGESSKQQMKDAGDSFNESAKRTWKCITTLFQKC